MKRFALMHKTDDADASHTPSQELLAQMGALIGGMGAAFVAGEGLQQTKLGARVRFSRGTRTVTHGPFGGSNELVASLALIRVWSIDEAIEWASRLAAVAGDSEFYIGQVKEAWDLGFAPKPDGAPTRYLIFRKSDAKSEAGVEPAIQPVLDEMARAGVLQAAERFEPSTAAVRLYVHKDRRTTVDGPFTESKELIGGYCIVQVATREQAVEWATRLARVICEYAPADRVEIDVRGL